MYTGELPQEMHYTSRLQVDRRVRAGLRKKTGPAGRRMVESTYLFTLREIQGTPAWGQVLRAMLRTCKEGRDRTSLRAESPISTSSPYLLNTGSNFELINFPKIYSPKVVVPVSESTASILPQHWGPVYSKAPLCLL